MLTGSAKSVENGLDVSTLLHRYDSQLIFFIYPNKESLVLIVEYTSSVGPVSVQANSLQESVALFKEEMISYELLSLIFCEIVERVISTLEVPFHVSESFADLLFNFLSLVIGDTRS